MPPPHPARPATAVENWPLQHLLEMLRDPRLESQKLLLKNNRIEVQRKLFNGVPCVEKRYLGNLSERQQYEVQQLHAVGGVTALVNHVASVYSTESRTLHQGRETTLRTRWHGHDTLSWQRLATEALGTESPFKRNVGTLLAWVRGVLKACEPFHTRGFVHCDLLPQNIVLRHRADNAAAGRYTLLLDQPFIIDLEFCLGPQKGGAWGTGQVREGWFDDDRRPQLLVPKYHSELICAGVVLKERSDDDTLIAQRKYQMEKVETHDYVVLRDPPFADLDRVDWGVDLFSLGIALQEMLDETDFTDMAGQPIADKDPAHRYLCQLPKLLRSYNQLTPTKAPRPCPHGEICRDIEGHLAHIQAHTHSNPNECPINLPPRFSSSEPTRPPAAGTTMLTTLDPGIARPVPPPYPPDKPTEGTKHPKRHWLTPTLAAAGLATAGSGAWWLSVNWPPEPSPVVNVAVTLPPSPTATTAPVAAPAPTQAPAPAPQPAPASTVPAPPPAPSPTQQIQTVLRAINAADLGSPGWQNAVGELAALCSTTQRSEETAACKGAWSGVQQSYLSRAAQAKDPQNSWWAGGYTSTEPTQTMREWLAATRTLAQHGLWVAQVDQAMGDAVGIMRKAQTAPVTLASRTAAAQTLAKLTSQPAPLPQAGNGLEVDVPLPTQREWRIEAAHTLWVLAKQGQEGPAQDPLTREARAIAPVALALPAVQAAANLPAQQAQALVGYSLACWQNQPGQAQAWFAKASVPEEAGNPQAIALAKQAQQRLDRLKKGGNICPVKNQSS